jgi:hypothetical protein
MNSSMDGILLNESQANGAPLARIGVFLFYSPDRRRASRDRKQKLFGQNGGGSVFNVKDSPRGRGLRFRGGMNQQRPHGQDSSACHETVDGRYLGGQRVHGVVV